jgi:hypothetical protein
MRIEGVGEHPLADRDWAHTSKRRVGDLPEKVVDIDMAMPEARGDRGGQSRGAGP